MVAVSFTIDCAGFRTVFAYRADGLGVDLLYFNRDGRTMATAGYDLLHAPRQLFAALDGFAAEGSGNTAAPLEVMELEFNMDEPYR